MRPVGLEDLDPLAEHRNQMETWRNLTSVLPVYPHRQNDWLNSLSERNMYFVGFLSDKRAAFLRLNDIDYVNRNACVGLDMFSRFRGKGHGQAFFNLIVEYSFDILNMHRLWLLVKDGNEAARRIYEKVGFTQEGVLKEHLYRDGKYVDYILMGMIKGED